MGIWSLITAVCYYTLVRPGTRLHLDAHRRRLFVAHHDGRICVWHIPSSPPSLQPSISDKSSSTTVTTTTTTTGSLERPELVEQLCVEAANTQATGAVIRCLAGDGWHLLCGCDDQTIKIPKFTFEPIRQSICPACNCETMPKSHVYKRSFLEIFLYPNPFTHPPIYLDSILPFNIESIMFNQLISSI
ncbi:unnamed protein product [Taenia asiatica]|uniref:WD_REPEATS_REGION domain-containing protein n=1 Tax=Taenia asiatica TaxID=60517 RepID=A0A0R3W8H1_TAEAS|nr:unnamed protein product [Taenia asiatica]